MEEIEGKAYDSGTLERQKKAWLEIHIKFSAEFPTASKRSLGQLKEC